MLFRLPRLLLLVAWIALWVSAALRNDLFTQFGAMRAPAGNAPGPAPAQADALPEAAVLRLGTTRLREGDPVTAVRPAPDGKRLATTTIQGTVSVWDMTTGKPFFQIAEQRGWGNGDSAFLPDGKTLLVLSGGSVQAYDAATGKKQRQLAEPLGAQVMAVSADGKRVATGGFDGVVRVYDVASGKSLRQLQGFRENVRAIAFSPDGKLIASGNGSTVLVWNAGTGEQLHKLRRHPGGVSSLAFSPDGQALASAGADNTVRLWETSSGKLLRQFGHHAINSGDEGESWRWRFGNQVGGMTIAFASDGKALVSASSVDKVIRFWDPATGHEVRQLTGHAGGVTAVAFATGGKVLVSAATDGTIRIWDPATGKQTSAQEGHQAAVLTVAFTLDGRRVLTAGRDNTVRIWDRTAGKELFRFGDNDDLSRAAFSPDGRLVALARLDDDAISLHDTATGKELRPLPGAQNRVNAMLFSPDSKYLLASSTDNQFILWDAAAGKKLRSFGTSSGFSINNLFATPLSFSADGKLLAARGYTQNKSNITLWDVTTGKEAKHFDWPERSYPLQVAMSPDGRYLASLDYDGNTHLWAVSSGKQLHKLQHQQRGWNAFMPVLQFSPDGRLLVTVLWDQTVNLWETATGKEIRQLKGHRGNVTAVAFAADGRSLASSSVDTTALVWDLLLPNSEEKKQATSLTPASVDGLWSDLGGNDPVKAHRAMRILLVEPKQALMLLSERLQPAAPVAAERLTQLIADLDSNAFPARKKAEAELEKLGDLAEASLREMLKGQLSVNLKQQIEMLLQKLDGPNISGDRLRALRAIGALEQVGTAEARQLLAKVAGGVPAALATKEAKASLDRLEIRAAR